MVFYMIYWHGCLLFGPCQQRNKISEYYKSQVDAYFLGMKVLEKHPDVHITVQLHGHDLDWIDKYYNPKFFHLLLKLLHQGQIEFAIGGYSHNFQGYPTELCYKDLELSLKTAKRCLGLDQSQIKGYWMAELNYSNGVPKLVKDFGLEYIIFHRQTAVGDEKGLPYPVWVVGAGDVKIKGIPIGKDTHPGFNYFLHRAPFDKYAPEGAIDEASKGTAHPPNLTQVFTLAKRMPVMAIAGDWDSGYASRLKYGKIGGKWHVWNTPDNSLIKRVNGLFTQFEREPEIKIVTALELLRKFPPKREVRLYDGRGWQESNPYFDIRRIADGTFYDSSYKNWTDYPQMGDVESIAYTFKSYEAIRRTIGLKEISEREGINSGEILNDEVIEDIWRQSCLTGNSAWRGSAPDYRHVEQVEERTKYCLDIYDNVLKKYIKSYKKRDENSLVIINPLDIEVKNLVIEKEITFKPGVVTYVRVNETVSQLEEVEKYNDGTIKRCKIVFLCSMRAREKKKFKLEFCKNGPLPSFGSIKERDNSVEFKSNNLVIQFSKINGGSVTFISNGDNVNLVENLGYVKLKHGYKDMYCKDIINAKISVEHLTLRSRIIAKSSFQGAIIKKIWYVYPKLRRVDLETVVYSKKIVSARMGGIDINSVVFDNKTCRFNLVSDGADVIQSDPMNENQTMIHAGNGVINYSGNGKGISYIIDKTVTAPVFCRDLEGGNLVICEQYSHPPLAVKFRGYPRVKVIFLFHDYEGLKDENIALAMSTLVKPICF